MSNDSQRVRRGRRLLVVVPALAVAALALSSCSADQKPSSEGPGVGTLPPVFTPSAVPEADVIANSAPATQPEYQATLTNVSGGNVGTAEFLGTGLGTTVTVTVNGLEPGFHSLAIASAGVCEASDNFVSAGEILNDPANAVPGAPKDGELPTLLVDANGNGTLSTSGGFQIDELTKAPGTALVLGSDADESSRIACGVIQST